MEINSDIDLQQHASSGEYLYAEKNNNCNLNLFLTKSSSNPTINADICVKLDDVMTKKKSLFKYDNNEPNQIHFQQNNNVSRFSFNQY